MDAWLAMKYLGEEVLRGQLSRPLGRLPDNPIRQAGSADTEATQVQEGEFQAPARGNQVPEGENAGLKNEEVEPVLGNQDGHQAPVNRNQEPGPDHHAGGTQQGSAETSEMEAEEVVEADSSDVSLETLPAEDQHPGHEPSSILSSISLVRDASESHHESHQSPETYSSFQHAPGGSVLLKILRGDVFGSSEEGGESESAE